MINSIFKTTEHYLVENLNFLEKYFLWKKKLVLNDI